MRERDIQRDTEREREREREREERKSVKASPIRTGRQRVDVSTTTTAVAE